MKGSIISTILLIVMLIWFWWALDRMDKLEKLGCKCQELEHQVEKLEDKIKHLKSEE